MTKRVVEHVFSGDTTPYTSYEPDKTILGNLIKQYSGGSPTENFAGPMKIGLARPMEQNVAVPGMHPHVITWCSKSGFYNTGTVEVSGTSVTGSGTDWLADGVPIGARIGFGSNDSADITTWYTIEAIPSGTSLVLEDTAGTISAGTTFVIDKNRNIDWVFLTDNATAAATRRTTLFTFNRANSVFNWQGAIIHTFPTVTNHTVRGFRVAYELYTTGTVEVSGATVTGTGTTWSDDRIFIGTRIGFGSTDPTQISTWYYINAINSNTSVTIQIAATPTGTGGTAANITIDAGTAYVMEDLRILHSTTNAITTNGGLFMTGCVSYDDFISTTGTTISAASGTDKVKGVYWLADAATVTNITACGLALDDKESWTEQYVYVLNVATVRVFKYNIRAALTLASGKSTNAFVFATGNQAVTGTISQANNGRVATLSHGPGSGVKSLYFVTTTRVYRAALSNITDANTTWQSDVMSEIPPGGTATFAATSALSTCEYSSQIDRLIITTSGVGRAYVTRYNTSADAFDQLFLADTRQIDQSSSDGDVTPHVSQAALPLSVWSEGGLVYFARVTTTAAAGNTVYAVPLPADWNFANGSVKQRLITPELNTSGAVKYARVYVNNAHYLGDGPFTIPTEPIRVYYRTSGIDDDSGNFNLVDDTGDLSGVEGADSIQFAIEFRMIGTMCLPGRIYNIACTYEDNSTDSHYQPSVGESSTASKIFAWRFATAFGGTVPTLRVRLYHAVTGALLEEDDSVTQVGTWEKSTDGGDTWAAYNTTDKANDTTYIRFTPASLGDDIRVRALLTQL